MESVRTKIAVLVVLGFAVGVASAQVPAPSDESAADKIVSAIQAAAEVQVVATDRVGVRIGEALEEQGLKLDALLADVDQLKRDVRLLVDRGTTPVEPPVVVEPIPLDPPIPAAVPLPTPTPTDCPEVVAPLVVESVVVETVAPVVVPSKPKPRFNILGNMAAAYDRGAVESHLQVTHGHNVTAHLSRPQLSYIHDADHAMGYQPGNGVVIEHDWFMRSTVPPPSGGGVVPGCAGGRCPIRKKLFRRWRDR